MPEGLHLKQVKLCNIFANKTLLFTHFRTTATSGCLTQNSIPFVYYVCVRVGRCRHACVRVRGHLVENSSRCRSGPQAPWPAPVAAEPSCWPRPKNSMLKQFAIPTNVKTEVGTFSYRVLRRAQCITSRILALSHSLSDTD